MSNWSLSETPFYPESGGQAGDRGTITAADGTRLEVYDVQRPVKGLVVHKAKVAEGELRPDQTVRTEVDKAWRMGACQAHSATHLIHEALHQILGPSALQAGSFNRPGYLRLDFSWNHAVSDDQRGQIELLSNEAIRSDLGVERRTDAAGRGEGVGRDSPVRRGVRRRGPGGRHRRRLVTRAVRRHPCRVVVAGGADGGER